MTKALSLLFLAIAAATSFGQVYFDDFNDNSIDVLKWSADIADGNGQMREINQRVEYSAQPPGEEFDEVLRPFRTLVPTDVSWEATLSTAITLTPATQGQNVSIGLDLRNPQNEDQKLYMEQYTGREFDGVFRGFLSDMRNTAGDEMTGNLGVTQGAVRLHYNASNKVVTISYSTESVPTQNSWQTLGSWGLGGAGGTSANQNWQLTPANKLQLSIEAFSEFLPIAPGSVWVDNFRLTIFTERPTLTVVRQNNEVVISWPGTSSNFSLQTTANLGVLWTSTGIQPVLNGTTNEVRLPIGQSPSFFRLINAP